MAQPVVVEGTLRRAPAAARQLLARRPWLLLLALLPLLLAMPFVAGLLGAEGRGDESGYLRLADNLLHGRYLVGRADQIAAGFHYPNLWFGPGLPVVLAPFVALDVPLEVTRLLGPLFVFLAAFLLYRLLRLRVSSRAALAGGLALGLYVPVYTVLQHLHSETLALLLIVAMMYGTTRYLEGGRPAHLLVAGLSLGWLALTRVAFGWVVIALLLVALVWWALQRSAAARRFAAVCAVALAVTVPWLAYTYSVTGKPLYWGASGGLSLYWASSPYEGELGDWHQAREVFSDQRLARHRPLFTSLIGRPLADQDEALRRAGLDNIRTHPGKYAENVAANVSRMWFGFPYSFRAEGLKALVFVLPNAFMLAALVGSLALLMWRRAPSLPTEAIPFVAFAVAAFSLHAVLSAYPRMLFPVIPVVIWLVTVVVSRSLRLVPAR
jgi:Dolichyl-phosphate-mannose-protein mannosyltransferase